MVASIIESALSRASGEETAVVTFSDRSEHGDYTTNVALRGSSGQSPRKVAEDLVVRLKEDKDLKEFISEIIVEGPGFINFFLSQEALTEGVTTILQEGKSFGKTSTNKGKRIIVEYSSPNIAKPFTIGHLRSTIIGDAVANLLQSVGWTVYRDNHLGDWGTQFGKQIYAIKEWGDLEAIEKSETPVKELVSLYVKFHEEAEKNPELEESGRQWFKKLEDGDPDARDLWQKCIDWSWKEFNRIYELLNVHFTENNGRGFGESYFEDKMEAVLSELKEKSLLREGEEGAQLVFFPDEKFPPLMLLKKDGATLYSTRDLATDKFRLNEYGKDVTIVNEVGGEQSLYFKQLFEVEKMLGWVRDGQRVHLKHGLFRFADKKMSTRKGNVIWLSDVLNEAFDKARGMGTVDEQAVHQIAVGALKWNELKRDPVSDIVFDWSEILNMKGNSGPYMQYSVVRIKSLLSKSDHIKKHQISALNDQEQQVVRYLIRFPEVIAIAAGEFRPSYLAEYLFTLAQRYNTFYDTEKIIGGEREGVRIQVSKATLLVLEQGLSLLGISVPEKM